MPWIQNVALSDIRKGHHIDAGINSMLIQICDPPGDFPTPKHQFKEVHQFQFLDIEEKDLALDEAMKCSQEQANELVRLLQHALENRMHVVVHPPSLYFAALISCSSFSESAQKSRMPSANFSVAIASSFKASRKADSFNVIF